MNELARSDVSFILLSIGLSINVTIYVVSLHSLRAKIFTCTETNGNVGNNFIRHIAVLFVSQSAYLSLEIA